MFVYLYLLEITGPYLFPVKAKQRFQGTFESVVVKWKKDSYAPNYRSVYMV